MREQNTKGRAAGVTLLVLFVLAGVVSIAHPVAGTTIQASANVVFSTLATTTVPAQANFWENESGAVYGASTPAAFVAALPGSTAVSSVLSSSFYLTAFVQTGLTPRLQVNQGSTPLANATVPYSISLFPAYSQTQVSIKVPSVYTSTGVHPTPGHFAVFYNGTTTVQFITNTTATWGGGGLTWKLIYHEVAPAGWSYSQTSLLIPFPSTLVNYSSVAVKIGSATLSTYIVETSGVYAMVPNLAVGGSQWINVTFASAALSTGPGPVVTAPHYTAFGVNTNLWQFNSTWTNPYTVPYAGPLTLTSTIPYSIAPSTVVVTVNNSSALSQGSYSVSGKHVTISPGVLDLGPGSSAHVNVVFGFASGPSSGTARGTMVVWTAGAYAITLNYALFALIFALTAGTTIGWIFSKKFRGDLTVHITLYAFYGILFYTTIVVNI